MKNNISLFLLVIILFFVSFGDFPKIMGMRLGYLVLPFVIMLNYKMLIKNYLIVFKKYKAYLFLGLYLILSNIFIYHDQRSIGFTLWYFFNLILLILINESSRKSIYYASVAIIIFGSLHILIQPFYDHSQELLRFVDYEGRVRFASFFGEPSYAVLYLGTMLLILNSTNILKARWKFLLIVSTAAAIALTGSKLYWVLVIFLVLINYKIALLQVLMIFAFMMFSPRYEKHFAINNKRISASLEYSELKIKTSTTYPISLREASLKRGLEAFKQNPIFGVGVGNSKNYIETNKILPDLKTGYTYEGIHNLLLEILVELGIVGTFIFTWLILDILQFKLFNKENLMFLAVFSMMQFCQNLNMPAFWMMLSIYQMKRDNNG